MSENKVLKEKEREWGREQLGGLHEDLAKQLSDEDTKNECNIQYEDLDKAGPDPQSAALAAMKESS